MKKIRLDLDALDVDAFVVAAAPPQRGTLHARQSEYTFDFGPCGGSGFTSSCPLHTTTCTQAELCYSRPGGFCDPTDYPSCYDDC